jgi:hypothetical protein
MEPARRRERGEPAAADRDQARGDHPGAAPGGFDQVPLPARMTVPGIWVYGRRAVPTRPRRAPRRCGPVRDSGARTSRSSCSPSRGTACSMCRRPTRARCRPCWRGSTSTRGRAEPRGRDPVESPPSSGHHTAQARHAEQPRRALMIAGLAVTEGDEARRRRDRQPGVPSPSQGRRDLGVDPGRRDLHPPAPVP